MRQTVTRQLVEAIKELSPERQEQLLEQAKSWTAASNEKEVAGSATRLLAKGRLDLDFLKLARSEVQSPPALSTVRSALAQIPGSLTADCIAERDER